MKSAVIIWLTGIILADLYLGMIINADKSEDEANESIINYAVRQDHHFHTFLSECIM